MCNQKKISTELKPFEEPQRYTKGNEYGNCFYSMLFMFLHAHHKSVNPYIANNIFSYNYVPNAIDLRVKYGMIENLGVPLQELYRQSGIDVIDEFINIQNVFSIIEIKISNNEPCCVPVDMFYLPFRKDRYQKIHSDHYILIYGYDNTTKEYLIFDNPQNSFYYQLKLSFNDFSLAYNSAALNSGGKLTTFKCLSNFDYYADKETNFFYDMMSRNLYLFQRNIHNGLNDLQDFSKELSYFLNNPNTWNNVSTNLFYLVHYHILNKKKSEYYAYHKILANDNLDKKAKNILDTWANIRNICLYFDTTHKYKEEMVLSAKESINNILDLEYNFYKYLYSYTNENFT